jgi:hypothetical protein
MQKCAITWLAWLDPPGVSHVAHMHFLVRCDYSFTAITIAN